MAESVTGRFKNPVIPVSYDGTHAYPSRLRNCAAVYHDILKFSDRVLATLVLTDYWLLHDAYIRLVDVKKARHWNSRSHFFGAAAKAMRRILIDKARRKASVQRGGDRRRENIRLGDIASHESPDFVLAIDEALQKLARENEAVARLVELRYFAGSKPFVSTIPIAFIVSLALF